MPGTIPIQVGNGGGTNNFDDANLIDWKGMNVIIEYGNVQTNLCDLQDYAQKWLDLSALTPGNQNYEIALEKITHTVIDANAAPGKPNNSAVDRIRSNERIFYPSHSGAGQNADWVTSDWELSQFVLDPTATIPSGSTQYTNTQHPLIPAPVANTPQIDANNQTNMTSASLTTPFNAPASIALINWVFSHPVQVSNGNHQLPNSYTASGTNTFSLAVAADMHNELGHFWDLFWDASNAQAPSYTNIPAGATNITARNLRRQLSINTCQGCHGGENKTFFTQVRPVGYRTQVDYWSSTPGSETGPVDLRFVENTGTSGQNGTIVDPATSNTVDPFIYPLISSFGGTLTTKTVPLVSGFLTGRVYNGGTNYTDDWSGDDASLIYKPDESLEGQYYVFDPADNATYTNGVQVDNTRPNPDRMNNYNDLLLRKTDLCKFINFSCSTSVSNNITFKIIAAASHIPLSE